MLFPFFFFLFFFLRDNWGNFFPFPNVFFSAFEILSRILKYIVPESTAYPDCSSYKVLLEYNLVLPEVTYYLQDSLIIFFFF